MAAHKVLLLAVLSLSGATTCLGAGAVLGSHLTRQAISKQFEPGVAGPGGFHRSGPETAPRQNQHTAIFPATCPTVFKLAT
jgi:hypothetical protein